MPPRSARKTSGGSAGAKKTVARTGKVAQKMAQSVKEEEKVMESGKVEEARVDEPNKVVDVEEVKAREKFEGKKMESEAVANGSASRSEAEGETKETYDEDDKGERLELDDNDAEYEPEEELGVDYDAKDVGNDDAQEEAYEYEEVEERDEGEDDAEMIQEIEDDGEDAEEEEEQEDDDDDDDENAEEPEVDGDEEEHHDVVQERRKRKEFEVFVGGLDKDATEDDLRKVFGEVGEIREVRLMMNPQTKKNKGFAFLRFATVEQAKRAVSELKNPVVNGKQCGVSPSQDSDTLFLGNINKAWTKEELKNKLKHYGIENVEDLTLVEDTNNKGMNRGFAFLEFSSRSDAMDAFRCLQRRGVVFGVDRSAKVAFADTFIEPDDEIMKQVRTIFVDGLPTAWDEDRVKLYLKKFGEIEKIELARNMPSAKRKDFGFVTFDTHDSAVACAEGINNAELGEGDNKVKVRARLSRPHQKGRGRVARGDYRLGRRGLFGGRSSWVNWPSPRRLPSRASRALGVRGAPLGGHGFKRPVGGYRDRYPPLAAPMRVRHMPTDRPYTRRSTVPSYPKSSSKWDYSRRNEMPSRARAPVDYESRVPVERRPAYRDDYASRGSAYSDTAPRAASRSGSRRGFSDDTYGRRPERPPAQAYRESRAREYDPLPGSKRPYSALDDPSPRYGDVSVRQPRSRMDYGINSASQYADAYGERPSRSHLGYGSSRGSLSGQESHEFYGSGRQGMEYGSGSLRSGDVGGMYTSNFGSGYMSRESDVGGSSYSSLYSGRNLSGSGYMGGGGSGSYY